MKISQSPAKSNVTNTSSPTSPCALDEETVLLLNLFPEYLSQLFNIHHEPKRYFWVSTVLGLGANREWSMGRFWLSGWALKQGDDSPWIPNAQTEGSAICQASSQAIAVESITVGRSIIKCNRVFWPFCLRFQLRLRSWYLSVLCLRWDYFSSLVMIRLEYHGRFLCPVLFKESLPCTEWQWCRRCSSHLSHLERVSSHNNLYLALNESARISQRLRSLGVIKVGVISFPRQFPTQTMAGAVMSRTSQQLRPCAERKAQTVGGNRRSWQSSRFAGN